MGGGGRISKCYFHHFSFVRMTGVKWSERGCSPVVYMFVSVSCIYLHCYPPQPPLHP